MRVRVRIAIEIACESVLEGCIGLHVLGVATSPVNLVLCIEKGVPGDDEYVQSHEHACTFFSVARRQSTMKKAQVQTHGSEFSSLGTWFVHVPFLFKYRLKILAKPGEACSTPDPGKS